MTVTNAAARRHAKPPVNKKPTTKTKPVAEPLGFARPYLSQPLTKAEAAYARKLIDAKRWPVDAPCFERSQALFLSANEFRLDLLVGEDDLLVPPVPRGMALRYVEGFSQVLPTKTLHGDSPVFRGEHAWLTLNGKVIDVTWTWRRRSIAGEFSGITYFGREFTEDVLVDLYDPGMGGTTGGVPDEEVDADLNDLGGWRMVDRFYWGDPDIRERCIAKLKQGAKPLADVRAFARRLRSGHNGRQGAGSRS